MDEEIIGFWSTQDGEIRTGKLFDEPEMSIAMTRILFVDSLSKLS